MMETKYGSACKAVPGYDVKIMKPDQTLAQPNEMGDIVVKTSSASRNISNIMERRPKI